VTATRSIPLALFATSVLLLACAPDAGVEAPGQPVGWDDGIRVPGAVDINPDPHVVELNTRALISCRVLAST